MLNESCVTLYLKVILLTELRNDCKQSEMRKVYLYAYAIIFGFM